MANIPHLVMFFAVGAGILENTSTFLVKDTMFGRDDSSKYCMMSTRLPQGSFKSYVATSGSPQYCDLMEYLPGHNTTLLPNSDK